MTDVTIIGLGAMGSALARALLKKGRSVTVWNRTTAKAAPLVADGAVLARTPAEAIAASPIAIVCVGSYADADGALADAGAALRGRTVVQLTTGSGVQARAFAERIASLGGNCLVGVIMAYPDEIGGTAMILFAGDDATWARCGNVLAGLGSASTYVGGNVALPATLDAALGVVGVAAIAGLIQGALLCENEGFSLVTYAEWMKALMPVLNNQVVHLAGTLAQDRFGETQAALKTYAAAYASFVGDARARGANAEVLQFLSGLLTRGVAAGYGDEEITALIKVLRTAPKTRPT